VTVIGAIVGAIEFAPRTAPQCPVCGEYVRNDERFVYTPDGPAHRACMGLSGSEKTWKSPETPSAALAE
jgi:hypothetical protein